MMTNNYLKSNPLNIQIINKHNSTKGNKTIIFHALQLNHSPNNLNQSSSQKDLSISLVPYTNIKMQQRNNITTSITPNHNTLNISKPTLECFICELTFYEKMNKYSTTKCTHYLCSYCIKQYYEDQIEHGLTSFKCPNYTCTQYFKEETIQSLISPEHVKSITLHRKKTEEGINKSHMNTEVNSTKFKSYNQKHLIDISSSDPFYSYNIFKNYYCTKCNIAALFGKTYKNYAKCLNCGYHTCKYCLKDYSIEHFDKRNKQGNYCRVFFRYGKRKLRKDGYLPVLYFLGSFLLFCLGAFLFMFIVAQTILCMNTKRKKPPHAILLILVYCLTLVLSLVTIVIIILIIPFFPLLNVIIN